MSDYKKSGIDRRDFRSSKDPEQQAKHSSNKNTRKWCKGKEGVAHVTKCVSYKELKQRSYIPDSWRLLICTVCGKELETWVGRNKNKPDWVE